MLGDFGYSNTEQKYPSQATFKAQLNKHSETRKTKQCFNKPHSFDYRKWENGISSIPRWLVPEPPLLIRSCQSTPVTKDFSGAWVKQPDMGDAFQL